MTNSNLNISLDSSKIVIMSKPNDSISTHKMVLNCQIRHPNTLKNTPDTFPNDASTLNPNGQKLENLSKNKQRPAPIARRRSIDAKSSTRILWTKFSLPIQEFLTCQITKIDSNFPKPYFRSTYHNNQ